MMNCQWRMRANRMLGPDRLGGAIDHGIESSVLINQDSCSMAIVTRNWQGDIFNCIAHCDITATDCGCSCRRPRARCWKKVPHAVAQSPEPVYLPEPLLIRRARSLRWPASCAHQTIATNEFDKRDSLVDGACSRQVARCPPMATGSVDGSLTCHSLVGWSPFGDNRHHPPGACALAPDGQPKATAPNN